MPSTTTSPSYTHSSPLKHDPNPHPYPIKTTSTALLTRSNSSPHAPPSGRHYYVPLASPARSRSGSEAGSVSPNPSKGGHRYSRSLTSNLPASLPAPPSPTRSLNSLDLENTPPRRSSASSDPVVSSPDLPPTPDELPSNPKTWSSVELSIYLVTALRSQSGETLLLPDRVARDISKWVRAKGITGRTFLRLNDADLEGMHLSTLWRTALLSASGTLRQNALKGQIWADTSLNSTGEEPQSQPSDSFEYPKTSSTSSSDANFDFASNSNMSNRLVKRGGKRYRTLGRSTKRVRDGGRVRGMVETWERSGSESEGGESDAENSFLSFPASLLASTSSPISAPTSNYTTAPSTPSSSVDHEGRFSVDLEEQTGGDSEEPTIEALLSSSDHTWGARAWEEVDTNAGVITIKQASEARRVSASTVEKQEEEEDGAAKSVVGWEDDDSFDGGRRLDSIPPFTVKHAVPLPASASEHAGEKLHNGKKASVRLGLGRGQGSKRRENGRERRVVTAIFSAESQYGFAPVLPDIMPDMEEKDAEVFEAVISSSLRGVSPSEIDSSSLESVLEDDDHSAQIDLENADGAVIETRADEDADRPQAAEAEIEKQASKLEARQADNRALLEVFRRRLEEVEGKVSEMEEQRERERVVEATSSVAHSSTSLTTTRTVFITHMLPYLYPPATSDTQPAVNEKERKRQDDSSLPLYVLLVGIGVFAIMWRAGKVVK